MYVPVCMLVYVCVYPCVCMGVLNVWYCKRKLYKREQPFQRIFQRMWQLITLELRTRLDEQSLI